MKAVIFDGKKLEIDLNHPVPAISSGEVLIQVDYAGICSTDLEITKGYMGFTGIPGHEFIGKVIDGPEELKGKTVTAEINCSCGDCDMCNRGLASHCYNRQTIGIFNHSGAFAEYIAVPEQNLHIIPDSLQMEQAILIEPLAAAFEICHQVEMSTADNIAVIGDGRLGLLTTQALAYNIGKDNLVLVGKHPEKLDFLAKIGYKTVLNSDIDSEEKWDIVVDCTGKSSGFELAVNMLRPRGKLVLKSTFVPDKSLDLSMIVINELEIIGSRCGHFIDAIDALVSGKIKTEGMITSEYKLENTPAAFEAARSGNEIKVILKVS